MTFIEYSQELELHNPVLVAAFGGWNDAADAATTALKFLIERWKPQRFADIDGEDFFLYTETRPTVQFTKGQLRKLVWPGGRFLAHTGDPKLDHDIVLYLGPEPQLRWKTFAREFLGVCKHLNISEVLLLGAFLANIPHSATVPITGSASNPELIERLGELDVRDSRYEGPTGMVGVIQETLNQASIPTASLWAAAPHYLAATPNIKVTAALLTYLNTFLNVDLDLQEIQSDAVRFEEQITILVERDPEAREYVRKLEKQVEEEEEKEEENDDEDDEDEDDDSDMVIHPDRVASTGPLPSADSLIRSVEELLRQQREQQQQDFDEDDDN
ncbi:MAG TPA: PAC2 family protein [Ktedonobacteraceae bacterium]